MKDLIIFRDRSYNFHSEENSFVQSEVKATYYGLPSISHLAPRIWHQIPYGIRKRRKLSTAGITAVSVKHIC